MGGRLLRLRMQYGRGLWTAGNLHRDRRRIHLSGALQHRWGLPQRILLRCRRLWELVLHAGVQFESRGHLRPWRMQSIRACCVFALMHDLGGLLRREHVRQRRSVRMHEQHELRRRSRVLRRFRNLRVRD